MKLIKYITLLPIEFIRSFLEIFTDKTLFKFSLVPFFLGFLTFILISIFGLTNVKTINDFIFSETSSWYEYSYYSLSFLIVILTSTILAFLTVLISSEFYLSKTIAHLFNKYDLKENSNLNDSNLSFIKITKTTVKRVIYFTLSTALLIIFSFFPILIVFWYLLNSYLIGIELFSVPLDELKLDYDKKLKFIKNNKIIITISGGILFLSLFIPMINLIAIQVRLIYSTRIIKKYKLYI